MNDYGITTQKMADSIVLSRRSIELNISGLKKQGLLVRKGSRKNARWEVNNDGE